MRFARIEKDGRAGVAVARAGGVCARFGTAADLEDALWTGQLRRLFESVLAEGHAVNLDQLSFLPLLGQPRKIICLGLNYADHATEGGFTKTELPTLFARFTTSLIGHQHPIVRPKVSRHLDFEGELAVIIGTGGRAIAAASALEHVAGYTVFNDASIRDWQNKTSQWMAGKNFDGTGSVGPWLVTADELPAGAKGLTIETRLNGETVQKSNTTHMIFGVAETIALLSEIMTLEPGDMIAMGTPAGVGFLRKPPLFMKAGDRVEVEVQSIGLLSNVVADE